MTREELLQALRGMKVETGSFVCLGCGHEHNCSTHGCAVLKAASREIDILAAQNAALEEQIALARREAMTPRQAANILRNANLGGVPRTAADLGIEALEHQTAEAAV